MLTWFNDLSSALVELIVKSLEDAASTTEEKLPWVRTPGEIEQPRGLKRRQRMDRAFVRWAVIELPREKRYRNASRYGRGLDQFGESTARGMEDTFAGDYAWTAASVFANTDSLTFTTDVGLTGDEKVSFSALVDGGTGVGAWAVPQVLGCK